MTGQHLALKILKKYASSDVFSLAKQAGVAVIYEKWHPVTFGEFDKKTLTISINLNAPLIYPFGSIDYVLAHELGHFFIHKMDIAMSKIEEEIMVEDFAKTITAHYASKTFSITKAYAPNISAFSLRGDT